MNIEKYFESLRSDFTSDDVLSSPPMRRIRQLLKALVGREDPRGGNALDTVLTSSSLLAVDALAAEVKALTERVADLEDCQDRLP